MTITTDVVAVGCTFLLAFLLMQLALMFRSRPGRMWALSFVILAVAQSFRFAHWTIHLVFEVIFITILSIGCRGIQRTRFWRRKSMMYAGLIIMMASLDAAQAFTRWSSGPTASIAFGDIAFSLFLASSLILLLAESSQWRMQQMVVEAHGARQQLEERLNTDILTEALSRHAFRWIQQGSEIKTDGALSGVVVMFDVDGLKSINDTYGHHAGDDAIRAAANAIRAVIRADDLLFRWGGDEFVAILPNLSVTTATSRLQAFERPIRISVGDDANVEYRLTWGIADFGGSRGLDDAIRFADQQMYGKRQARGQHGTLIAI